MKYLIKILRTIPAVSRYTDILRHDLSNRPSLRVRIPTGTMVIHTPSWFFSVSPV